jgi:hypothetical protein
VAVAKHPEPIMSSVKYGIASKAGRGRCLVATTAVARGEIILQEAPTALVVSSAFEEVVCGVCMQLCTDRPVFVLTSEDTVRYCSKECITADHPVHSKEMESFRLLKGLQKQLDIEASGSAELASSSKKLSSTEALGSAELASSSKKLSSIEGLEAVESSLSPAATQLVSDVASKLEKIAKIKKVRKLMWALQCVALCCDASRCVALRCITLLRVVLRRTASHRIALRRIASRFVSLRCIASHRFASPLIALCYFAPLCIVLRCVLRRIMLRYSIALLAIEFHLNSTAFLFILVHFSCISILTFVLHPAAPHCVLYSTTF